MAYRETRRYCKTCGRETKHWRPWTDWRDAEPPQGIEIPIQAILGVIRSAYLPPWRCLECDHPWDTSLLGRRRRK